MAREYVIQIHSGHGPLHYDLMLACGKALATWRLAVSPAETADGRSVPASKLPDHRRAYLTYEGPVSNDRGQVRILDAGTYELLEEDPGRWRIRLAGNILIGTFELTRCGDAPDGWTFSRLSED